MQYLSTIKVKYKPSKFKCQNYMRNIIAGKGEKFKLMTTDKHEICAAACYKEESHTKKII